MFLQTYYQYDEHVIDWLFYLLLEGRMDQALSHIWNSRLQMVTLGGDD